MITLAEFPPDLIFDQIPETSYLKKVKVPFQVGDKTFFIKVSSMRLRVFKANRTCSCCGLLGTGMLLQNYATQNAKHFNFFGEKDDGELVLMTKDHIIPVSKGGNNTFKNMQTMCYECNQLKKNRLISNCELLKEKEIVTLKIIDKQV